MTLKSMLNKLKESGTLTAGKGFYKSIKKIFRNDKDVVKACDAILKAIDEKNETEIVIQGATIQGLIYSRKGKQ